MAGEPAPTRAVAGTGSGGAFMGLGVAAVQDPGDPSRTIVSRGENYRHIRHAEILDRWPVLAESWARRVEEARLRPG
jgi:hypothetical protein